MRKTDPRSSAAFENRDLQRLLIFIYLIPVVGFLPAIWTLYQQRGNREQRHASRLVVVLTTGWILGYVLLGMGAQAADSFTLPLLIVSSLLTSGYFLVNIWLMICLWQGKTLYLPGLSRLGDRLP